MGYVPLPHRNANIDFKVAEGAGYLPDLVPDPPFSEQTADVGLYENQSFWIIIKVPGTVRGVASGLCNAANRWHKAGLTMLSDIKSYKDFPRQKEWVGQRVKGHTEPFQVSNSPSV
jgi:hypothetical protein